MPEQGRAFWANKEAVMRGAGVAVPWSGGDGGERSAKPVSRYIKRRSVRVRRGLQRVRSPRQLLPRRRRTKRPARHGQVYRHLHGAHRIWPPRQHPRCPLPARFVWPKGIGLAVGRLKAGCPARGSFWGAGGNRGAPGRSWSGCRAGLGAQRAGSLRRCSGAPRFPPAQAVFSPRRGGSAGYCRRLDEL